MLVPHVSGVRLVVDEMTIGNAWVGILEGVPSIEMFLEDAHARLASYGELEQRLVPVAWKNAGFPVRMEDGKPSRWTPERKAGDTPRWLCSVSVHYDDGSPEGERRAAIAWFSNRALARGIEQLLVDDVATVPLEGDIAARLPDAPRDTSFVVAGDGADVRLDSITMKLDADVDVFPVFAARAHRLPVPRTVDAPVLVRAEFSGAAIVGPRNPDPEEYYASTLSLAWIAEAPTEPLGQFVQQAIGRVRWHELATPDAW